MRDVKIIRYFLLVETPGVFRIRKLITFIHNLEAMLYISLKKYT